MGNEIKQNRRKRLFLLIITICTAIVRVYGAIHNMIPTASEVNFLHAIERMTNTVSLDTQYYNHPDNIILIVEFIVINLFSLISYGSLCTGTIQQVMTGDTSAEFFANHIDTYLQVSRVTNVCFSLLAIYFIYRIAEEIKENSGLLAALLTAVFPSYNVWSGCVLSDTAVTAIAAIVIFFAVKYLKDRKRLDLVLTTVFCGVCTAQKYTAALTCLIVIVLVVSDHIYQHKKAGRFLLDCLKDGIQLIAVYLISFTVCAPNVVTNFGRTIQILISEGRPYHQGADGLGFFGNLRFYGDVYWTQMGVLLTVAALFGVIWVFRNKRYFAIPVLWGVAFGVIISIMKLHWERWGLAIYITPIVFGAVGIQALLETLEVSSLKWRKPIRNAIMALLAVVVMCIATDVWLDMIVKALPDTRYISAKDVTSLDEAVTTDNSYVEWWTPLAPNLDYDVYVDAERMNKAEYVMVASYNYDAKFSSERFSPNVYKENCDWYRKVFDEGTLIYQIQPWIKYKLLRDVTEYGDVIYTVPIVKAFTNIRYIADYYMHPEGKYYGPLISIYKMK